MGISKTANDGLKVARGKFISFIGSDDVWFLFKLEKQLNLIKNNEDKILWSEGEIINSKGCSTGRTITQLLSPPGKKSGNIFQELLKEDFIFGQSVLFKTEYAKKVAFNEEFKYVKDHLFYVELSEKHEFMFIPDILSKYRIHGNNATLKNEKTWMKERIILRKSFLKKYRNKISTRTMVDIYYKIGHAYSRLGEKELAQKYYLKAIRINSFHTNSFCILYLH